VGSVPLVRRSVLADPRRSVLRREDGRLEAKIELDTDPARFTDRGGPQRP
jgi:hypothetical protein